MTASSLRDHRPHRKAPDAARRSSALLRSPPRVIGLGLFASVTPSPLYRSYSVLWDFSPLTLTLIYATYAFGVLASLLLAGSVSDDVGRRPVLLASLGALMVSSVLYMLADSAAWLFVGARHPGPRDGRRAQRGQRRDARPAPAARSGRRRPRQRTRSGRRPRPRHPGLLVARAARRRAAGAALRACCSACSRSPSPART